MKSTSDVTSSKFDNAEGNGTATMPATPIGQWSAQVQKRVHGMYDQAAEMVRQHPMTAVGIAAGTGFMLGVFGRRLGLILAMVGLGAAIKSAVTRKS
jgi:ElaB/YqjD/DUF883 family membrane-anchored ribosome-binding protein